MNKQLLSSYLFCTLILSFLNVGKVQACTGRDIVFTNIAVTSISSDQYQYSYTIKNIGTADIAFNQLTIQNYVSTDDQVGNDAAGGGSYIDHFSTEILSPGETYSGVMGVYPFPANPQSTYPYIIANVYIYPDEECDVTNNYIATPIQITTSLIQASNLAKSRVGWIEDNKSFIVREWPGNHTLIHYTLYTSSGILIFTGNTQKNIPTPVNNLQKGSYILYLSDGENEYSQKIMN